MLTQTARYAIRAMVYLAQQDSDMFCQTREIAQTINVPPNYLGKTLQKLAHARVLDSQKGLYGGFRTARSSHRISLYEIMVAIEAIPRDMIGSHSPKHNSELPSDVYWRLNEISSMYTQFLRDTTLADLLPQTAKTEQASAASASV